mmetsp:Transcript_50413/g.107061  ORF Transcript_50413/g.107061 Transcript_50413/m.107061 type:complete len:362 (-) Transcript_50413:296-1381(-)|eukprot:CAMPEP_0206467830 /NCGR_PEP_ID=MMETSP0324_2-20121206/29258_1 /ASSEMBLY_ACC=CAM_ASM_000836 /TAXON_ID=2866 /ORGANISM="Crypthecodinium cohnii, Strain Seligo" /LENGTH=361 /DNA_ID=CAMNT_0053941153 /DNA_START=61 /DNA_END=1146 /DNA_ORIENTATION=-
MATAPDTNDVAKAKAGGPLLPFLMVFGGCMSSMVFMEYVLIGDRNAGNFINATEFVFVLLQSIPSRVDVGNLKLIPLKASWFSHIVHALLWVLMSTLANYVFAYNISIPIHTLFRSCNIIASVCLGFVVFGQRYNFKQIICVMIITIGIFLASIGDARKFLPASWGCSDCGTGLDEISGGGAGSEAEFIKWTMGITMLLCVQITQATLGHTQAVFYKKFSNQGTRDELADEYLFTAHICSLGVIMLLWEDISTSAILAWNTEPLHPLLPIPRRMCWVILNNFTQLACIKGVFRLSANYSPLTVNVTLSVRKFLSVVLSAVWFGNPWTNLHSIATVLIFGGVFAYSNCPKPVEAPPPEKKKE